MRNIFELTKREQRIVIVIVTLLVAIAFAKHFRQTKLQPAPTTPTSTPEVTPAERSKGQDPEPEDSR